MSEDEGQEKPFEASQEKINKARRKGNVPLSLEVLTLASYAGLAISVLAVPNHVSKIALLNLSFISDPIISTDILFSGGVSLRELIYETYKLVLLIPLPSIGLVLLSLVLQRSIVFAPTKIKPDLKKINPIEGFKKKYGKSGIGEFLKSGLKMAAVLALGLFYIFSRWRYYGEQVFSNPTEISEGLTREIFHVLLIGIIIAFVVSLIDLPVRWLSHKRKLRMTRQEMTDESKELEGDPAQKMARKKRGQELSQHKMLKEVGNADVVIVNPTHYAVALKWDGEKDTVPVCVAKGMDHFALTLIDHARRNTVPVREDPPCARSLYATVEVGSPIEPQHYRAVAAAIRFAQSVKTSSF